MTTTELLHPLRREPAPAPADSSPSRVRVRKTPSITTWVKAHFAAQTIGGQTVYDLTEAA